MKRKRVCVLTGASGLFGQAFIRRHAGEYDLAVVHERHSIDHPTQHQQYVDPIDPNRSFPENDDPIFAVRADLSDQRDIEQLADLVLARFKRVDVLINAAAYRQWSGMLDPGSLDHGERHFSVNVLAPLRLAARFADKFWADHCDENVAHSRNVINISSTAGIYVYPDLGQCLYSATKAALNFATYHLASEFWHIGIRVNAIAPNTFPGIVKTERVLDETLALDRCSDTGQVITIDTA